LFLRLALFTNMHVQNADSLLGLELSGFSPVGAVCIADPGEIGGALYHISLIGIGMWAGVSEGI